MLEAFDNSKFYAAAAGGVCEQLELKKSIDLDIAWDPRRRRKNKTSNSTLYRA